MPDLTLYIGTRNISSWSLRAWLMLKLADIDFNTIIIELDEADTKEKIMQVSPSGKVPVLKHDGRIIWDSLAIGEYLAEIFPHKHFWPPELAMRAVARSLACEVHSSFAGLRKYLPMDIKKRVNNYPIPQIAAEEIQRVINIWLECRKKYNSDKKFLFGEYTIVDAMFAPIATRFITYKVRLPEVAIDYVNAIMEWPAMKEWCNEA